MRGRLIALGKKLGARGFTNTLGNLPTNLRVVEARRLHAFPLKGRYIEKDEKTKPKKKHPSGKRSEKEGGVGAWRAAKNSKRAEAIRRGRRSEKRNLDLAEARRRR